MDKYSKDDKKKYISKKYNSLGTFGIVVIILIVLFVIFICTVVHNDNARKQKDLNNIQSKKIYSFNLTETDKSDKFILGVSNTLDTYATIEYYFYMESSKGYSLEHLSASNLEIVPTDNVEPHIEGHFNDREKLVYTFDIILELDRDYIYEMTHYTLYVPSNYAVEKYNSNTEESNK